MSSLRSVAIETLTKREKKLYSQSKPCLAHLDVSANGFNPRFNINWRHQLNAIEEEHGFTDLELDEHDEVDQAGSDGGVAERYSVDGHWDPSEDNCVFSVVDYSTGSSYTLAPDDVKRPLELPAPVRPARGISTDSQMSGASFVSVSSETSSCVIVGANDAFDVASVGSFHDLGHLGAGVHRDARDEAPEVNDLDAVRVSRASAAAQNLSSSSSAPVVATTTQSNAHDDTDSQFSWEDCQ